jgi:hypothetical protein
VEKSLRGWGGKSRARVRRGVRVLGWLVGRGSGGGAAAWGAALRGVAA